jgi:hypothetical protein
MDETYESFRDRLIDRHTNPATSALSTVGDVVMYGGLAAGVVARKPRIAALGLSLGFGVAVLAHLFQPGTLGEELRALFRHPSWALKAECERVARRQNRHT